jgi:hypothetical protein
VTNPLRGFFDAVVAGGQPNDADLEREGFPRAHFSEVRAGVRAVHRLKADGEMGKARTLARELAGYWADRLGDELQPPASSDPLRGEMDPRKLAEGISRW